MGRTGKPRRVDVYRRRSGVAGERFRYLLTESSVGDEDALARAIRLVKELRHEFPEYQYLLVIVRRSLGNGWQWGS